MIDPTRIVITGCCGSGKSHLATRLKNRLEIPVLFLDQIIFERIPNADPKNPKSNVRERDREEAKRILQEFLPGDRWIIEGVYGKFIEEALLRATFFIWIDRPEKECLESVRTRNREMLEKYGRALNQEQMDKMTKRVWNYRTRNDHIGYAYHQSLYENFGAGKRKVCSFFEADRILTEIEPKALDCPNAQKQPEIGA